MKIQNINDSGWSVIFMVDEDKHLSFWVSHRDGSKPIDCGMDQGSWLDSDDCEFGMRLTTEKIEADYLALTEGHES